MPWPAVLTLKKLPQLSLVSNREAPPFCQLKTPPLSGWDCFRRATQYHKNVATESFQDTAFYNWSNKPLYMSTKVLALFPGWGSHGYRSSLVPTH